MDLNLLSMYDALLRAGSVTGAAAEVGLSKAAVSHALARLRAQVGDPILVRSGGRFRLSARAETARAQVAAAAQAARALLSPPAAFEPRTSSREFRIHATDQALALLGISLGHVVSQEAHDVALRFLPVQGDEAAALRDGGIDLAVGVFHELTAEFHTQTLFRDRFACVVRKGHPRIRGRLTLATFLSAPHVAIAPRGRPGSPLDDALAARGLKRRAVRSVPYNLLALDFVSRSDCICVLSARLARSQARRFGLQVLSLPIPIDGFAVTQVWHPRVHSDPAHVWLRRLVAKTASALRSPDV